MPKEKIKKEKVHYIYKIHFLCGFPAGRYYLGKHSGYIGDSYAGSGDFCKKYFKKYGKIKGVTYIKEVLEINPDKQTNKDREIIVIGKLWKTDPLCMNRKPGEDRGTDGGEFSPMYGKHHSEETKRKISLANKVRTWTNEQYESAKNRKISESTREKHKQAAKGNTSHLGFHHSEETKRILSEKNTNNPKLKCKRYEPSEETKQLLREKFGKPIKQYDLNGNFIKEWSSLTEAAKSFNSEATHGIANCCNKNINYKTVFGYIWRWADYVFTESDVKFAKNSSCSEVLQFDSNGTLIAQYSTVKDAANAMNVTHGAISICCSGKRKTCKGYIFKYKNDNLCQN